MESLKKTQLAVIAQRRKRSRWPGYACVGDYHGGLYDCDFVSPYTKSAGNVDSPVMVMLQDWASHDVLARAPDEDIVRLGRLPSLRTNLTLDRLLLNHMGRSIDQVYATNLFPFVKPGGISSKVSRRDLLRASKEFGLPQVQAVSPRLVIALGLECFNALVVALGYKPSPTLGEAIATPVAFSEAMIWCQAHTGWGGRNRGGAEQVEVDWGRMATWFFSDARQSS